MGGRGSSSGFSVDGKKYGTEYHTVLHSGNIKFVQRNEGSANAPFETMTRGRVYVTVNAANEVKFISYYDNQNKRRKTIDLGKAHHGLSPHVHHGYEHKENETSKIGASRLTTNERKMVAKVLELWYSKSDK